MRTTFRIQIPYRLAWELEDAAASVGLPPAQFVAQIVEVFIAERRMTRLECEKVAQAAPGLTVRDPLKDEDFFRPIA